MDEAQDSVTSMLVNGHEIITGYVCRVLEVTTIMFFFCTHEINYRSVDGFVRCYDIRMGKLRSDDMHSPVTNVSLSNDGNCTLVGCLNDSLRILSKEDGTLFLT